MKKIALGFAILAVACLALGASPLYAAKKQAAAKGKVFTGEIFDSACAAMGSHEAMKKKAMVGTDKECTLKCVEMGSKFVLFNAKTKTTYELDDQEKPKEFAGEKVKVTGTLEGKTIHVESIAKAGAAKAKAKKAA